MERLDVAKTPFCRVVVGARVLEKVIAGTVTDLERCLASVMISILRESCRPMEMEVGR